MSRITDAMEHLADRIRAGVDRPVTTDPRNVVAPCVLVPPPMLTPGGVACGGHKYRWRILVVGTPGARAELDPLGRLLDDVLEVLEDEGPGWTLAELVAFEPYDAGATEPSMAYQVEIEEYAP
ncbi:hypothetical protein GCM10010329_50160 [Streptomyces spiroverticillatus]|uniref:DUF3168 domain-containing protein n=1 Tax=Streptomyces finlayi TaxID=67296 RepID=A0A918X1H1_9ACTN|nr:hypothetical protein [Streptomyces finlayi]GHA20733.1 hypothetical protein GCM10010329_50160 [Streptomyces spiroverticillatus]GHD03399.1 hypothetical protein GCM10010334_51110 [Streptomyces finlayi]